MTYAHTSRNVLLLGGLATLLCASQLRDAAACGCFTPPDPSVPVVQAGERIVFAMQNGEVVAHIQIQYQGDASEFGWLLPLPSLPTLELGTDELFNQLTSQTQPKYRLTRKYEGNCLFQSGRGFGGSSSGPPSPGGEDAGGGGGPLVVQGAIGPYDYAVLHADSKDPMLQWLSDNHYFVPAGTDATVGPYIHTGAYFLALKLRSGQSTGDLQPVVVRYPSDLPMIPIVLTSVGAKPHMGIQVWMLGAGRAIPRNYYHTVVNDALVDYSNGGQNYNDLITKAVGESIGKHSFVTEFAGASSVMKNILNYPGRFGSNSELAAQPDATSFVQYLYSHGYGQINRSQGPFGGGVTLTSQLIAILSRYIPEPPVMAQHGVTADQWFQSLSYYLTPQYQQQHPGDFAGWAGINYQPAQMATEIDQRVVQPTLQAAALFDTYPYLTRMYSTLSPEDMNKDPVFSYNAGLPDYKNVHDATLTYHCGMLVPSANASTTPATLLTEQGWVVEFPGGVGSGSIAASWGLPGSWRIEILREEGGPEVVTDNTSRIRDALGTGGCSVALGGRTEGMLGAAMLAALALGLALALRRRGE
ncbi:MAG TPA: DUF2330 domain-containing protein [Polyangia bacterium]|nr:DUF2330 domain-containing protein [Polyangia bacterium]